MDTCIFDLETSSLYADSGILLCCVIKPYKQKGVKIFRADKYKSWKTDKLDQKEMIVDIMKAFEEYDLCVAHNGRRFDKAWLNSLCILYGQRPAIRFAKFLDPVELSRFHLRLSSNSLRRIQKFLKIKEEKTDVEFEYWLRATHNSDKSAMDKIVKHCVADVVLLHEVYRRLKPLNDKIDKDGSSR